MAQDDQINTNNAQAKPNTVGNVNIQPKPVSANPTNTFSNPVMTQNKNPLSGFKPPRFWLIFGGLACLVLILIFVLSFFVLKKKSPTDVSKNPETAQKAIEQSPVALPAIKSDDNSADELKVYFVSISPAFSDEFMAQVPEIAKDAYKKYKETTEPAQKLEAARAFFIYLNNPGSKTDDPIFKEFLEDVKSDLETALGETLF